MGKPTDNIQGKEFTIFMWARIVGGLVLAVLLVWGAVKLIDFVYPEGSPHASETQYASKAQTAFDSHGNGISYDLATQNANDAQESRQAKSMETDAHAASGNKASDSKTAGSAAADSHTMTQDHQKVKGVAFVEALASPIQYELKERFWGWRPNDIIKFTDNVNEYQLGVLEVTRRTSTRLTENISRTGSTAVINKYLERAMNSFMIRADRYLFPSAENQYQEAIENLNRYKEQLISGEASFYSRADNLIPLLQSLVELVGSCDEMLVKKTESNGKPVSTFTADNYYYYAKGVASALLPILQAIEHDFKNVLEVRSGADVLHHAIESCHHAAEMKPWLFITEANLNGIFANHRANMAAPMSHVRFYMSLLATTLST